MIIPTLKILIKKNYNDHYDDNHVIITKVIDYTTNKLDPMKW